MSARRLKINWFAPSDPRQTEVARFSGLCLPGLKERFTLCRVSDCTRVDEQLEDPSGRPAMQPINVYHLGNGRHHYEIMRLGLREPGIVVLHDCSLLELTLAYGRADPAVNLVDFIAAELGESASRDFTAMFRGERYDWCGRDQAQYDDFVTKHRIHRTFIGNALGVVVHSAKTFEEVRSHYSGPMAHLNLPCESGGMPATRSLEPPVRVVFCGHAGANRRLQDFISAWSSVSKPQSMRLSLYGHIDKVGDLLEYAAERGLDQFIEIHGFVEEPVLQEAIDNAHLAINLRYPTVGEASASQLRYMCQGVATLVSDIGWYSELPDDCVVKVPPQGGISLIAATLTRLLEGDESMLAIGMRGYEYVVQHHTVQGYIEGLHAFVDEVAAHRFADALFEHRLLDVMAGLCEDSHDSALFRPTLARLSGILSNPQ